MFERGALAGAIAATLLFAAEARAEDMKMEPSAELEIGVAGEWGLPDGRSSFGPSAARSSPLSRIGSKSNWVFRPYLAMAKRSGAPNLYSRRPLALSKTWRSRSVLDRNGCIRRRWRGQ